MFYLIIHQYMCVYCDLVLIRYALYGQVSESVWALPLSVGMCSTVYLRRFDWVLIV